MCATVGAKQGTVRSLPFILGLNIPILIYALVTGFGLAALLYKVPLIEPVLTVIGSLYVVWLGVTLARSGTGEETADISYGFKSGFAISALNFKVMTVLVLMYSQFTTANVAVTALLAVAFVAICLTGHFIWNFVGQAAASLVKNERFLRIQNAIYGVMLIGVGCWMLYPQLQAIG